MQTHRKTGRAPSAKRGISGHRFDPIRWTVNRAADEFGLDRHALSGRLKRSDECPGPDNLFSTQQICRVVFGDLESERIREVRSKADLNEQQLRKQAGQLVDVEDFARRYDPIFTNFVRVVKSSKLTEDDQIEILNEVAKLHEVKE
jgi:hypothetical protein